MLKNKVFLGIALSFITLLSLNLYALNCGFAVAQPTNIKRANSARNSKEAVLIMRSRDNRRFFHQNHNERRSPASLTKMMTLYILFDRIASGKLTLKSRITISKEANMLPPSKIYMPNCATISVEEAILATIIKSANNIAYAIAEKIAGSELNFVRMMNMKARALGMKNTHFSNSHGLFHIGQYTTAHDMFILAKALQERHSTFYKFFKKTKFTIGGQVIVGHNKVLSGPCVGVDGIKTGYTRNSGFNIVTSVRRGEDTIIGIVFGRKSAVERDSLVTFLIEKAFKDVMSEANAIKSPVTSVFFALPKKEDSIFDKAAAGLGAGKNGQDAANDKESNAKDKSLDAGPSADSIFLSLQGNGKEEGEEGKKSKEEFLSIFKWYEAQDDGEEDDFQS